jgi:prepilin-type N-terminal cleavage/methylation domain-containing protein
MRRGTSQAGFTLIEASVALAVVAVALFLAAGMLREAHVLAAAAGRQLHDPLAGQLAARLRADLQAADRLAPPTPIWPPWAWTSEPLCLAGARSGGLLCWQPLGAELHRRTMEDGASRADEIWLKTLAGWRWRQAAPGLVDLEVTFFRAADAGRWRLAGAPAPPPPLLATDRLRLALRGAGRGSGW